MRRPALDRGVSNTSQTASWLDHFLTGDWPSVCQWTAPELANKQWEKTTTDGITAEARYWIDDLYMITAVRVQTYRATGDARYIDRAAATMAAYLDKLVSAILIAATVCIVVAHDGKVASSAAAVSQAGPIDVHDVRTFGAKGGRRANS